MNSNFSKTKNVRTMVKAYSYTSKVQPLPLKFGFTMGQNEFRLVVMHLNF